LSYPHSLCGVVVYSTCVDFVSCPNCVFLYLHFSSRHSGNSSYGELPCRPHHFGSAVLCHELLLLAAQRLDCDVWCDLARSGSVYGLRDHHHLPAGIYLCSADGGVHRVVTSCRFALKARTTRPCNNPQFQTNTNFARKND